LTAFEEQNPLLLEDLSQEFHNRVGKTESVPEEDLVALQLAFSRAPSLEPVEVAA